MARLHRDLLPLTAAIVVSVSLLGERAASGGFSVLVLLPCLGLVAVMAVEVRRKRRPSVPVDVAGLLQTALHPMLLVDAQGRVFASNSTADQLAGRGLRGSAFFDELLAEEDAAVMQQAFSRLASTTTPAEGLKARLRLPHGVAVPMAWVMCPLRDEIRALWGAIIAGQVIHEEEQTPRQAERMKEQFSAMISHDLRAPLSSIVGYLNLIQEGAAGEISEDLARMLRIIERNSSRVLVLVEDLLLSAQVEAGRMTLSKAEGDLRTVVTHALESAKPHAAEQGVSIAVDLDGADTAIHGDMARLGQVVDNLLSNAVKYTPRGGAITVRLSSIDDAHLCLEVSDTGIGMTADDTERLFARFFRASTATGAAIPGVGLGLVIVKSIVEGHGGTIAVRSRVGEGTTFSVTLPRDGVGHAHR